MIPDFTDLYKRWKGKVPREEDKIHFPQASASEKEEIKITDNYVLGKAIDYNLAGYSADYTLLDILQDCVSLPFALGKYKSLAHILNDLGIEVVISNEIPASDKLRGLDDFLKRALKHWEEKLQSNDEKQRIKAEKIISEIKGEIEFWKSGGGQSVLGWYLPSEKKIELFPKVMETLAGGNKVLFVFYLITTFIHEVMHAYFDRPEHDKFPYAYFVEEPLAEFGMLLFLKETIMPDVLQDWAYDNVAGQRNCYRHGATLFDQYNSWNSGLRRYLEQYKYNIDEFDIPDITDVDDKKRIISLPAPMAKTTRTAVSRTKTGAITPVSSSSKGSICFEANSSWRGNEKGLYFSIGREDAPNVASKYNSKDKIKLTFIAKSRLTFTGIATIVSLNSSPRLLLWEDLRLHFATTFGKHIRKRFRFQEIKHGEWIAEEL